MSGFASCDYGRALGLSANTTREQFIQKAKPCSQAKAQPYLLQVAAGAEHLIWPGALPMLVAVPRLPWEPPLTLPVSLELETHFRETWRLALLASHLRSKAPQIQPAPMLGLGFPQLPIDTPTLPASQGILSALLAPGESPLPCPVEAPDPVARLSGLIEANPSARTLVLGDPLWLSSFLPDRSTAIIPSHAVNPEATPSSSRFQWAICLSPTLCPVTAQIRRLLSGNPEVHEIFMTEMGIFAVNDSSREPGLRLIPDSGIFFEFIPYDLYRSTPLESLGSKALMLGEVQVGCPYVMLVSTPAGLCRFDTGELVRFSSTKPHRIIPLGYVSRILSCVGEELTEHDIATCITACCDKHSWNLVHYHVAPGIPAPGRLSSKLGHEWWVELKPGSHQTPTGPALSEILDKALSASHPGYAQRRQSGQLEAPVTRLVIPGIFERWLREAKLYDARFRLPRCLPDRRLADPLAKLARFSD